MSDAEPAGAAPAPGAMACPRCGATVAPDQAWCLECGLAARTRLARTPRWHAPLVLAGAIGLAAIVALVVAFLVLTGDNAPLPTTAAPAATATTVTVAPVAVATTTVPVNTVPTTPDATPSIPETSTVVPTTTSP